MKSRILMTVDNGASLSKAFYRYEIGDSPPVQGIKKLCSVTRQLTERSYQDFKGMYSDNSCLVHFGDEYWAVGDIARTGTLSILVGQRKIEDAIAKCLAMVGSVCLEVMGLGATEIELTFGTLLPLDEWGDAEELQRRLKAEFWKFSINGQEIETILGDDVQVSPEGYGISTLIPSSETVNGVLIMGHRDVTWAHHEEGAIIPAQSKTFAGWGMHQIIQGTRFSFKDELLAARAIFAYCCTGKDKHLLKVASERELPVLKEKIENAIAQTWIDLVSRLTATSLRDAEVVYVSGGTSYLWRKELKGLLKRRLEPGNDTLKQVGKEFPKCNAIDAYRVADNFLFWRSLAS